MGRRRLFAGLVTALVAGVLVGGAFPAAAANGVSARRAGPHPRAAAPQRHETAAPRPVGPADVLNQLVGPGMVFVDYSATGGMLFWHSWTKGNPSVALPNDVSTMCPDEPRTSPDGLHVVYIEWRTLNCDGQPQLKVIDLATSAIRTIATAPTGFYFSEPGWSPDSATILYTLWHNDNSDASLFTIPQAGGAPTAIPGEGLHGADGVFSPDGTEIAYSAAVNTVANYLAVMHPDGTLVRNLTGTAISPASPTHPVWSPDGSKISYTYEKSHPSTNVYTFGIAVTNADDTGNHALAVTTGATSDAFGSSWSPDSTEIFYDAHVISPSTGNQTQPWSIYATKTPGTHRTVVVYGTVNDDIYSPDVVGPGPSTGSVSTYTPITPTRVQPRTTVASGSPLAVQVAGGASPVPLGATAVTLDLTGVTPTQSTYLQVYPDGTAKPLVSNLNLVKGQIAAVAVQVTVPANGKVWVANASGSIGVIVDVTGYFTAGTGAAGFVSLALPHRVADSTLPSGGTEDIDVSAAKVPGAPANPVAVVLNLTGANPSQSTYESVVPTPLVGKPATSNLNLAAKEIRANLVTVAVGTGGHVTVFNASGNVRTVVDVVGYYTNDPGGLGYYPLSPTRVLDTRAGWNTLGGSLKPIGQLLAIDVPLVGTTNTPTPTGMVAVPTTAQAVVFNLTAVSPTASTYLTAYATGPTRPTASNLNAAAGKTVPNLVFAALGTGGAVRIFNDAGATPVVADLAGYYAP
jgi:hypothetical protein